MSAAAAARAPQRRLYLDTSAYLCVPLGEEGWERLSEETAGAELRLAHLRTALWFHAAERIDRFVTTDGSQQQAAKEMGLPV